MTIGIALGIAFVTLSSVLALAIAFSLRRRMDEIAGPRSDDEPWL